jgi:hypothetical protein
VGGLSWGGGAYGRLPLGLAQKCKCKPFTLAGDADAFKPVYMHGVHDHAAEEP